MTISDAVRERVAVRANQRCEYCQMPAVYVYAPMEIDHIRPLFLNGTDDEDNLCFACPRCNGFKGAQIVGIDPVTQQEVNLFNPRIHTWSEHFAWADDQAHIIGQSVCGRATVAALQLNTEEAVSFRRIMVSIGGYPPDDIR